MKIGGSDLCKKIGVFDSGIGGEAIADRLRHDYPDFEVMYVSDQVHMPYGNRMRADIIDLTTRAVKPLIVAGCDVIVIACNTATAAAIDSLRGAYPEIPFVGLEPMIKPAAELTKTGVIAVCATPFTLGSEHYLKLKDRYGANLLVIEPDCSDWAHMIEFNKKDDQKITDTIVNACESGADVIVLACTHYHWIREEIVSAAGKNAVVIDPSDALSKRVGQILAVDSL